MIRHQLRIACLRAIAIAIAGGAISLAFWSGAEASNFKVLHSFCSKNNCGDGSQPESALLVDPAGNLFGTTVGGGDGHGVVFELQQTAPGKFKFAKIYTFCRKSECSDGSNPFGGLILDVQGNIYGTAGEGGSARRGVAFKLSPGQTGKWTETVLYDFCHTLSCPDGSTPQAGLTFAGAASGALYDGISPLFGTTSAGGANNAGTVFELEQNGAQWTQTVIYSFCSQGGSKCTDGAAAQNGLLMDGSGNLYGTTFAGGGNDFGSNGAGAAFELTPNGDGSWTETVLHRFCSEDQCADGAGPVGPFISDATGALFGTTSGGGADCKLERPFGCGTIYKLIPNGTSSQETVLYTFCAKRDCKDGADPEGGVVLDSLGNLFGVTFAGGGNDIDESGIGGGTAFELSGASLTVLHRFCSVPNCGDGEYPDAGLAMDSGGSLYGVTNFGGAGGSTVSSGAVFRVTP